MLQVITNKKHIDLACKKMPVIVLLRWLTFSGIVQLFFIFISEGHGVENDTSLTNGYVDNFSHSGFIFIFKINVFL